MNESNNQAESENIYNPQLVYEASEKDMNLDSGQCGACQRRGFPLFLVRKSIVPRTFKSQINWSNGMVSLGDREPERNWLDYQYAYRTLREGYVYILCNRIGNDDDSKLEVMAYEVTHSGGFRLREFRDVKGTRPKDIPLSCLSDNHQVKAQFVTIDNRVYDKAWVAYSSIRWTLATINHYKENLAEREQRFSHVDLTQQTAKDVSKQNRSFLFRDFFTKNRFLLELECSDEEVIDYYEDESKNILVRKKDKGKEVPEDGVKSLFDNIRNGMMTVKTRTLSDLLNATKSNLGGLYNQVFCTASHFNSLHGEKVRQALDLTVSRYEQDNNYGTTELTALVVEDPLGLAEELSIQRRQRLAPVIEGLAKQDENDNELLKRYDKLVRNSSHNYIYYEEKKTAKSKLAKTMQKWDSSEIRDTFAQFYQENNDYVSSYPLSYFTPEIRYARNHYQSIMQYKQMIKSSITQAGDNDFYLFLFYDKNQDYQKEFEKHVGTDYRDDTLDWQDIELKGYFNSADKLAGLNALDKIYVLDVVGETYFAEQLGISDPHTLEKSKLNHYLFCRRLSLYGLSIPKTKDKNGFGDYKSITLSEAQQTALLSHYHQSHTGKEANQVNSVMVVHFYNLSAYKDKLGDKVVADHWDKHQKRLNQPSIDNFEALEKSGYQSLYQYVNESSQDYYHYLIWLWGEDKQYYQVEDGAKKEALPQTLNSLFFWRNEVLPNCSDMHISFLLNVLQIFDSGSVGNIELPIQSALWAMLFENKQSIYFYLLGDTESTVSPIADEEEFYFRQEVKDRQARQDGESLSEEQQSDGVISNETIFNAAKGTLDLSQDINTLQGREENVSVLQLLLKRWLNTSLEGVIRASRHSVRLNELMVRDHFLRVMNLFTGSQSERILQYEVKMTVRALNKYMQNMHGLMPFFFNSEMRTARGQTLQVSKNIDGIWQVENANSRSINRDKVKVSLLAFFKSAEEQQNFESILHRSGGRPAKSAMNRLAPYIIEMSDTVYDSEDIEKLSKALSRNKRNAPRIEKLDSLAASILNGVGIYFQIQTLQNLESQLDTLNDPITKETIKYKIFVNRSLIVLNTMDIVANITNLAKSGKLELYFSRTSSLYRYARRYKIWSKTLAWIGVYDAMLSCLVAFRSYNSGNTGSGVLLVTSLLSLAVSLTLVILNVIPFWGQIAALIIVIGTTIIEAIYYSDGSDWDELDKWLNRSMLGNYDHKDKYPLYYLPTPICMRLSQQDFYLAVNGGRCVMEADSSWYDFMNTDYDLYLMLNLPDFDKEKAKLDGTIMVTSLENKQTVILSIKHGRQKLEISPHGSIANFKPIIRQSLDKENEYYRMDEKEVKEMSNDEQQWNTLMSLANGQALPAPTASSELESPKNDSQIGLFLIKQCVGQIRGDHEVEVAINYWPNGKQDENGQEITPYLLTYHYRKD
ncbi:hypothetical protein DKK76_11240 [Frischella perrara]|uniref:Toxin VasX N-terminal region domain-containing protein n=1 Tax=Frischella perrara TaxID=1267021 RepID=A0A318N0P5_FRIPE|nr:toxin VasX [Frischella perrara]PXY94444.1 hypothetical protein DKK76_11240 [Frischella perrara]